MNLFNQSGLSWWLSSKESTRNAGEAGDSGSVLGLGRFPGEWNGNPLQYSCLENSMDRRASRATVHNVTKSRTRLSDYAQHSAEFGMDMYTLLCLKFIVNKDLLYSTWNSAQCYVTAGWERSLGEMNTCICMAESLCCSPETTMTLLIG